MIDEMVNWTVFAENDLVGPTTLRFNDKELPDFSAFERMLRRSGPWIV